MVYGSTKEILRKVGECLKQHRLDQNITQQKLAERCGVSVSSVKNLEVGRGSTLETFIEVTRGLSKDGWIGMLEPTERVSPLAYAEAVMKSRKKRNRRRASKTKGGE